ncbi:aminotransferase class III-fold pyridoxal phosphate-dependent enzyme [Frigidibacter sp. RF13]|uniref:aspartate aminotransferase family protein n=1 Tax=Frigidibacter sp. RF13 TaxID=2997340 RepID=UPI00226E7E99|nr:aminotransferase class III-fold pyridoxal phosphate-dependent enzyme [Frigidibacter sp. RF13]MCY1128058.1 aminotransferase class III-fold pyridoxal phosphate-dependent enzyme [Frigidibacter sp. RF13]
MSDLLERRAARLGPNVPTFYREPVQIVRGEGVWLYDADGRRYLDCYNNVPHVGHCHPKVVEAIARQSALLNTHTRYLHTGILDYLDRLTATFGHGLSQSIMVCTGSEANDIALRMAQAATGKTGLIATDNTYHGNTAAVSALNTRRPPIGGWPPHIRRVPAPDWLAPNGLDGAVFAGHVTRAIRELEVAGYGCAALILCPIFANEGLPDVAPGFLDQAVAAVRKAGGLILSDEVQPGFGRLGRHWWGHEWLGFAPDVATMGKPMGNGYPVAGVVARPDVMAAFREAFGYFNTFGGNPVACAAASAVLDVIEEEGLMAHAARVSDRMAGHLVRLSHPLIAGTRARGLFFAVELAQDGKRAPEAAEAVVEKMKARGILIGRIGRAQHILKLRPPMPFGAAEADFVAEALADSLAEVAA